MPFFTVLTVMLALLLSACGPASPPAAAPDPAQEAGYRQAVDELSGLVRQAEQAFAGGKPEEAGASLEKAKPLYARVLSISRPSRAAVLTASGFDDLYGRMLMSNQHHGWARMLFQKNVARWKSQSPRDEEVEQRLAAAKARLAEADKALEK